MRGSGPKLPGYRDSSTRPDNKHHELAVSGAFADASDPPPPRQYKKRPKKPRKRRNAEENIRERFFSLRLTFSEHAALLRAAGDVSLGVYIRSKLFDQPPPDYTPRRPRHPVKDEQILGQLLGQLGQARLANNLNQLAKAANAGAL